MKQKRLVIIGATSAIAEHCARLWLQEEALDLSLVARSQAKLDRIAADLAVRSPHATIRKFVSKLIKMEDITKTVALIIDQGPVDLVLIAQGALPDQKACQENLADCEAALAINGLSPVLWAEAFATELAKANQGTLALIGSVAGDRGRKSNYVYGAAKSLVASYMEGLQHRFAGTKVAIVLLKPGPTETPMTAHLKNEGIPLSPVAEVAGEICLAIKQGKAIAYVPRKWQAIMWLIKRLPRALFNKLNI